MWIVLSSLILVRVFTNASNVKPVVSLVYQLWKTGSCEAASYKNLLEELVFMENDMEVGKLEIQSCHTQYPEIYTRCCKFNTKSVLGLVNWNYPGVVSSGLCCLEVL